MFTKLNIMIKKLNVMIFSFPVKWAVMFFKFNVMFLLHRIMLPRLGFNLGCGAIFVMYEKAYTKMAPQGAIPNYLKPKGYKLLVLTVPFSFCNPYVAIIKGLILIKYRTFSIAQKKSLWWKIMKNHNQNHHFLIKLVL